MKEQFMQQIAEYVSFQRECGLTLRKTHPN